jgi:hypothetical protein
VQWRFAKFVCFFDSSAVRQQQFYDPHTAAKCRTTQGRPTTPIFAEHQIMVVSDQPADHFDVAATDGPQRRLYGPIREGASEDALVPAVLPTPNLDGLQLSFPDPHALLLAAGLVAPFFPGECAGGGSLVVAAAISRAAGQLAAGQRVENEWCDQL